MVTMKPETCVTSVTNETENNEKNKPISIVKPETCVTNETSVIKKETEVTKNIEVTGYSIPGGGCGKDVKDMQLFFLTQDTELQIILKSRVVRIEVTGNDR